MDGMGGYESQHCDCEANGWVREQFVTAQQIAHEAEEATHARWIAQQNTASRAIQMAEEASDLAEQVIDNMIAATARAELTHHECDNTCRYSRANNNGMPCTRSCDGAENPGWEPVVEAPSQTCARRCRTCRHSRLNNATQALCCVGGCTYPAFQKWELYIPTINVLDETYYDHGGRFYSKPTVGLMETEPLRFKVPEEE